MPTYPCDLCADEVAVTSVSDMTSGDVKFIGPACLPLMGLSFIAPLEPAVLDAVLKQLGYQPTKATRDARKADEAPEYDASRTIGEVVESEPRPPDTEPDGGLVDMETDRHVDKSTIETDPDEGNEVVVGETMDGRFVNASRADDPEDPAPY